MIFIGNTIITSNPSDIVLDDSTVTLSCSGTLSVSGNMFTNSLHETSIMWYHDGTPAQSTNTVNINDTLITNTLTIDRFTISSVGDYRCVAIIDNSTAETTTTIKARRKPIYCTWFYSVYTVLPPSSVSVIPVEDIYTIGDTVTLTCTVIANVPDPRNTAYIRWSRNNNNTITSVDISPTPVNDMYSINYTYPLTINNISLSDSGQCSCTARIRSSNITNVMDSDTVIQDTIVTVKCEYIHDVTI